MQHFRLYGTHSGAGFDYTTVGITIPLLQYNNGYNYLDIDSYNIQQKKCFNCLKSAR